MKTHNTFNQSLLSMVLAGSTCLGIMSTGSAYASNNVSFRMVPSVAATTCLPKATGSVTISPLGPVENMHVEVRGLPPKTNFDFFVLQVPDKPFGLSWYQGDIETDQNGVAVADFAGRFNIETFIVAPGSDVAPKIHGYTNTFPDADTNPATGPIHTFHLGLWFNSPADALASGCPDTVTPFNGDHSAGIQVLNTSQFPKNRGPLWKVRP